MQLIAKDVRSAPLNLSSDGNGTRFSIDQITMAYCGSETVRWFRGLQPAEDRAQANSGGTRKNRITAPAGSVTTQDRGRSELITRRLSARCRAPAPMPIYRADQGGMAVDTGITDGRGALGWRRSLPPAAVAAGVSLVIPADGRRDHPAAIGCGR